MLKREAIDGSPERAQHGDGERRNKNEESDEVSLWNAKIEERLEEAVIVLRIVEWKQLVQLTVILVWLVGSELQ